MPFARALAIRLLAVVCAFAMLTCTREAPLRVEPKQPLGQPIDAAFDPQDESRIVVVERAGAIVLWKIELGATTRLLTIHTNAVKVSFDGSGAIVSVHRDGSVHRWRMDGSEEASAKPQHPTTATALAMFGDLILTADTDGWVHLWTHKLALVRSERAHDSAVLSLAAHPKSRTIVTIGVDQRVRQWGIERGRLTQRRQIAFDGTPLVAGISSRGVIGIGGRRGARGVLDLINPARGNAPTSLLLPGDSVSSLTFSALADVVVVNGDEGPLTINLDGTIRPTKSEQSYPAESVIFSPRGETLAAFSWERSKRLRANGIRIYKMSAENLTTVEIGSIGHRRSRIAPYGDGFVVITPPGKVVETDARGAIVRTIESGWKNLAALGVSHKHGIIAYASDTTGEASVRAGDAAPIVLMSPSTRALAVSRESGLIATVDENATLRVFDRDGVQQGEEVKVSLPVRDMVFLPTDILAMVGGNRLELKPLRGGASIFPTVPDLQYWRIVASPDGTRLAVGATDGTILLLTAKGEAIGKPLRPIKGEIVRVVDLVFSPREPLLAAIYDDGLGITLWDIRDGTARTPVLLPARTNGPGRPTAVGFAAKEDTLLTIHETGEAGVYAVGLTDEIQQFGNGPLFMRMAVSPDGGRIATWGQDGAILRDPDGSATPLRFERERAQTMIDVAFGRDGTLFGVATRRDVQYHYIVAYDAQTKTWELGPRIQYRLEAISTTKEGEAVVVQENALVRWKPRQKTTGELKLPYDKRRVVAVGDGEEVVLVSDEKSAIEVANREKILWSHTVKERATALAGSSGTPPVFAVADRDGTITIWQRKNKTLWQQLVKTKTSDGAIASVLAFDGDGKRLFVGTLQGALEERDPKSGALRRVIHIGYVPVRVGITPHRIWVSTGEQLFFFTKDLDLTATITPFLEEAIVSTPRGFHSGVTSHALFYRGTSERPLAEKDVKPMFSTSAVTGAVTGRGETWSRITTFVSATLSRLGAALQSLTWKQWLAGAPTTLYLLAMLFTLLTWLFRPHKVAEWAMERRDAPEPLPWNIKWLAQAAMFIRWLGHSRRAVDAWLARWRTSLLSDRFEALGNVKKRAYYVDLGNEGDVAAWQEAVSAGSRTAFWIHGPGGCGKSTMAFKLARTTAARGEKAPVPIVIDTDWEGSLLDAVRARVSLHPRRRLTESMIRGLAGRGRILVIVDGLSERRAEDARKQVVGAWTSQALRYLIVAARSSAPRDGGFRDVEVGPLTSTRLSDFVRAYIADEETAGKAVEQLTAFTEGKPIAPLFAKLAIDRVEAGKSLPLTYPQLVHDYVVALRPAGPDSLLLDDFLRAARVAAIAAVEEDLAPRQITAEFLRGRFPAKEYVRQAKMDSVVSAAECITQLTDCGLLERIEALGTVYVRFAFDPIAEYLAAMAIAENPSAHATLYQAAKSRTSGLAEALQRVEETRHRAARA